MARKLLIIPIFHSGAEMGSARESLEKISEKLVGREKWEAHKKRIIELWDCVERLISEKVKTLDLTKLKVYQDGQVLNGKIGVKMVEDIAAKGSKNHQILLQLILKGAIIMRTESFELLKEEYMLIKNILTAKTAEVLVLARRAYKARKDSILEARDRYIAKNIDKTLGDNEVGIIFIGATHSVERYLPKDIETEYLEDENLKKLKKELFEVIAKPVF